MIARRIPEKPAAAWTAEQVVERLLERMAVGDFYIVCPDSDVREAMDRARLQWHTDDVLKHRPALSRRHPDFAAAFAAYMRERGEA